MAADSPLMALFGRSPVKPMQEHIKIAHHCVTILVDFFDAAIEGDYEAASDVREQITTLENQADELKKDIRVHLPNSLFMPVPRSDLLELLSMQDRLANAAKDISGVMLGREMEIPKKIRKGMRKYLIASVNTSERALNALSELDELFETGFGSKEVKLVSGLIIKLDKAEQKTDELEIKVRKQLRTVEKDFPPVDIMFVYKVIELIGDMANYAQRVGSRMQILLAR